VANLIFGGLIHWREWASEILPIEDIRSQDYVEIFGGMAAKRGALSMARIHLYLGESFKARQFAMAGLAKLGPAAALKPAVEEILKAS